MNIIKYANSYWLEILGFECINSPCLVIGQNNYIELGEFFKSKFNLNVDDIYHIKENHDDTPKIRCMIRNIQISSSTISKITEVFGVYDIGTAINTETREHSLYITLNFILNF